MAEQKDSKIPTKERKSGKLISRRSFLAGFGKGILGFIAANTLSSIYREGDSAADVSVTPPTSEQSQANEIEQVMQLVAEIEGLSLKQLEALVFSEYPVVPNISKISNHLKTIGRIQPGSVLMKAGTSVSEGMLYSLFGESTDTSQINLSDEQYKVEKVLSHFRVPPGALDASSMYGIDIPQLLYDPTFCDSPNNSSGVMPCPPNTSLIDAYIQYFHPKVAINFVGTNLIRNNTSLEQFALFTQQLISNYLNKGVIPILTTFPEPKNSTDEVYREWFEEPLPPEQLYNGQTLEQWKQEEVEYRSVFLPEHALKFNVLLLKMAEMYNIPIINMERGVVEMAESDGTVTVGHNTPEIDPVHFSQEYQAEPPLKKPGLEEKFKYGEQAVSYFTLQTLYEILAAGI